VYYVFTPRSISAINSLMNETLKNKYSFYFLDLKLGLNFFYFMSGTLCSQGMPKLDRKPN